jgi:aromatic ring-opening dioxygenase catalytic subunit (LigB family)
MASGERCRCSFAGRGYEAAIHQPLAEALLTGLVEADFDMVYAQEITLGHAYAVPFEFVLGGRQIPVVPVFINTYLPPLPSARRCAALGAAIARIVAARPERVALLASGGLSHYPGTWKYPQPAFNFDRWAIAQDTIHDLSQAIDQVHTEPAQHHRAQAAGMLECQEGRDPRAHGIAHHIGLFDPEMVEQSGHVSRHFRGVIIGRIVELA